ncbi:MAG: MlaD family protein [Bacteroidota bacterium]|nr:MlaD family protein [Bacteroidota bacterium]MDQ6890423.1 MlaD family protein [Bacteroidota bacterium]
MKINNETKIGLLAIAGVALLVFGFNYLKGKSFFKKERHLYAKFQNVQGLSKSNSVIINGLQVGNISNLDGGKDMKEIVVTVNLTKDVNIPVNSLAVINPNLLGNPVLEIQLGSAQTFLNPGDTLITSLSGGAFDEALKLINPVLYEVRNAVKSLDSVLHIVTGVFDPSTKNNIKDVVANLNATTASFALSAVSLQQLLNNQTGALAHTLENVNVFTANLNSNNQKLNDIIGNAKTASAKFAAIDLKQTLDTLNAAVENFKKGSEKINSKDGSLGLLLNDKKLYDNLESTTNKINILLDDIRVHPKRYVNISIFGKKDKGNYITAPLIDDTLKVVN